jgi:hypothetical protein
MLIVLVAVIGMVGVPGCGDPAAEHEAEQAAARELAANEQARKEREAALEVRRLADLWTYHEGVSGKDRQVTASIYSTEAVDTGGDGPNRVQLVFRDHSSWGQSSYLVLQGGDFNCYSGCNVLVTVDDAPAAPMAGRRPKTDEAIAMFINDERALWRLIEGAKRLTIEFPVRAGGTRTASFDVAGLDRSRMPGWDAPTAAK